MGKAKTTDPKVSVIIPTYNRAELLKRAINSVLNQEYLNFEILVIDDSQGDESEKIVKGFPQYSIRYLKRKQRDGIAAARNLGVEISTGDYIAFLDDDDEWLPNKLALQIDLFQRSSSNVGLVHSNCFVDNGLERVLYHKEDLPDQSTRRLLEYDFVSNSTGVVKRDCFSVVGYFDETLPYCEDWDLYIRISKRFRFEYIHEPTAILHWKINSAAGRASLDLRRVTRGCQLFFAKHWQDYAHCRAVLSRYLWYIGVNLNVLGERDFAAWYFLKAFLVYPANFLPLISFFFFALENSAANKKLGFANVLRRFGKRSGILVPSVDKPTAR